MGFGEAVKSVFSQYAVFSGRARRSEYWFFGLFNFIVSMILTIISAGILSAIWTLVVFIPGLAVSVRRLHDIGKSGWWYLMILVPLVGPIVLLIFECTDSQPGSNQWGPNPKGNNAMNGGGNEYIEPRNFHICQNCGSNLVPGDKFCKVCGARVMQESNIPPVIEPPKIGICPQCGTNYGNNVPTFCTTCGQKLK